MTFGAPDWFWGMALLPLLLALFVWNQARSRALVGKLVALRLMPALAGDVSHVMRWTRFLITLLGLALIILSLAQPRLGFTVEQTKNKGRDVMIAIDTSKSMLANDIAPSRLARAKLAAEDLIRSLPGDRTGLVAFAGDAFLEAPMTIDYGAVLDSIRELDVNTIPTGGTNIAQAIDIAAEAFGKGESQNDCLVLFTDGEELDGNVLEAARRQQGKFRIYTVGIGSKEGAIIPIPEENGGTGFIKDADGTIVRSKLDEEKLAAIAKLTGGFYTHLQNGPADMKRIVEEGIASMNETEFEEKLSHKPIERYQWPLAAGLLCICASLLMNERKRPALGRVAIASIAISFALNPGDLHAANRGIDLYEQKDFKGSYDDFHKQMEKDPSSDALRFDQGTAAYQLGNYEEAIAAFGKALISNDPHLHEKAEYNLGNSLFRRAEPEQRPKPARISDLKNAIQHYGEAIKADSKDADAAYNKALAEQRLKDLMREDKQQESQKDQQQDQKKDQKDQNQKDQQNQDKQQKQDQKTQDQKGQQQSKNQQGNGQNQQGKQDQTKQDQGNQDQKQQAGQQQNGQSGQDQAKNEKRDGKDQSGGQDQKQPAKDQPDQKAGEHGQSEQADAQPGNESGSPKDSAPGASPTPDRKLSGKIEEQAGASPTPAEPVQEAGAAGSREARRDDAVPGAQPH